MGKIGIGEEVKTGLVAPEETVGAQNSLSLKRQRERKIFQGKGLKRRKEGWCAVRKVAPGRR